MSEMAQVLVAGRSRSSVGTASFQAMVPSSGKALGVYLWNLFRRALARLVRRDHR